jgi:hypothetical protein
MFDIAAYTATAHRVRTDDVDHSSFADQPLSQSALRCLLGPKAARAPDSPGLRQMIKSVRVAVS